MYLGLSSHHGKDSGHGRRVSVSQVSFAGLKVGSMMTVSEEAVSRCAKTGKQDSRRCLWENGQFVDPNVARKRLPMWAQRPLEKVGMGHSKRCL